MSLFCLLIVPAFYLLRRSLRSGDASAILEPGVIAGFVLGLAAAFFRFSWGDLFLLRGFGLSAFLTQLIDGAPFDGLLPAACYALLRRFGTPRRPFDAEEAVSFSLAWLVPVCAFRSIYWSSVPDPVRLILVPILFVVLASSFPYWIRRALDEYGLSQAAAIAAAILAPLGAAAVSWSFFTCRPVLGAFSFFAVCAAAIPPMLPLAKNLRS